MDFASFHFLVFFPLVALLYFQLSKRYRRVVLLAASFYFYATFTPVYLPLILAMIVLDFWGARVINRATGTRRRSRFTLFVALHLFSLLALKYEVFFATNLELLVGNIGAPLEIPKSTLLAPVGFSFQTLTALSYLIEVYAGRFKPARFITVAQYLLFFPQQLAGPIERPQNTMPQFEAGRGFNYVRVTDGLKLMSFGFLKKLVLADRIAVAVNLVYGNVADATAAHLLIATVLYSFQIYCDFSGYTDIALGAAQVFGIQLAQNFRQPYLSRSVTEFWQRWHISLSTWLRDYLYFPLARKIRSASWRWLALLVTFVISGLWHGAAWTFVVWGAIHGFYLITELGLKIKPSNEKATSWPAKIKALFSTLLTFAVVTFAWIFFRAANMADAFGIIQSLPAGFAQLFAALTNFQTAKDLIFGLGFSSMDLVVLTGAIALLMAADWLEASGRELRPRINAQPALARWALYYLIVAAIIFLGVYGHSQFIYFQF